MSDRLSRNVQALRHSTTVSSTHTATNPAGHDTVIIVTAVPLRTKNTSDKLFLCGPLLHLQDECLHTSLSLCLCFFFFFDFLFESLG